MSQSVRDIVVCVSVILALAACSGKAPAPAAAPVPVVVAHVRKQALPELASAVGNVEAINSVAVKSLVDGELLQSQVKDGDSVRKGQLLFKIDPRPAQAALAQADAALARDLAAHDLAQAQVTRYAPVAKQGFLSAESKARCTPRSARSRFPRSTPRSISTGC